MVGTTDTFSEEVHRWLGKEYPTKAYGRRIVIEVPEDDSLEIAKNLETEINQPENLYRAILPSTANSPLRVITGKGFDEEKKRLDNAKGRNEGLGAFQTSVAEYWRNSRKE